MIACLQPACSGEIEPDIGFCNVCGFFLDEGVAVAPRAESPDAALGRAAAFEEFTVLDKSKGAGRPPAGLGVYDLGLSYGEEGDRGTLWVASIKVLETRP